MTPIDYQNLADRTNCDMRFVLRRLGQLPDEAGPQLLHAALGISGEAGELCSAIQNYVFYGQDFDKENVKEELGFLLWYIAECCNAMGLDMEEVMEANIAKLKEKHPEKFSSELPIEENRNRTSEMKAVTEMPNLPTNIMSGLGRELDLLIMEIASACNSVRKQELREILVKGCLFHDINYEKFDTWKEVGITIDKEEIALKLEIQENKVVSNE